ncbi:MAG: ABC transporter ATP-binding protein [Burkholderiaceae bacterium]|nr:ABC transporter ATP-binding protein [Burkholderiaceae bacterium]
MSTARPPEGARTAAREGEGSPVSSAGEVLLAGRGIRRVWGGLVALDDVSIEVRRGEVHALIGTNGAGKSTLVNILAGEVPPSAGRIELLGHDVGTWSQPRRARAGLARSYQRTTIFPGFSVLENCRLCAQAKHPRPWAIWSAASRCEVSLAAARLAATRVGLGMDLDRPAGLLSHGGRRQLEIGMCLATQPQVLLLDEPLAGMGAEETDRMLALIDELRPDHAILLVEHDMDAVFRIADRITVMIDGQVIASGLPDAIRSSPEVQTAYLGEQA